MSFQSVPPELLRSIRRLALRTNQLATEAFAGNYRSAFKGQGMDFEEFREYQDGDDARRIDWNVSARVSTPLIRLFREERELTVVLAADRSASDSWGSGERSRRFRIAEVAALLAFSAVRNGDRVGLMLFTDRVERIVRPAKGQQHAMRCLRDLLYHPCSGQGTDIPRMLGALNHVFRRRAIVFLLSDFLTSYYESALRVAAARHDLIAVHVADPAETALPDAGWIAFADAETGETLEINTGDPRVRAHFARDAAERIRSTRDQIRRCRAGIIPVDTEHPFERSIRRFFELRRAHR